VDLAARTPSAILLVDDDRWYDVRPAYEQALARLDYPYDVWNVATQGAPRQDILETYPVVIWFTGYDWFDPLSRRDQEALARYIERGGRIFLSGQDILDNMRLPSPLLDVLGIVTYTPAITVTTITAVAGHPIADGLDSYRLTYPYSNYSDHMTVTSPAAIIFVGDGVDGEGPAAIASQRRVTMTLDGQPVAPSVSVFGRGVFFAFPFEGLASSDATLIMDRIVRWLHPLAGSRLAASTAVAAPGQVVTYTVALRNSGVSERAAAVSAPLPDLTTYVPGSAGGGAAFDAQSNRIVWPSTLPTPVPGLAGFSLPELFASPTYGQLRPGETLTITYAARLAQHIAPRSVTTATVEIIEDTGLILRDWQRTDIDAPRIQAVSNVARPLARIGDVLTYRLAVSNTGTAPALLFITSTIPMSTTFVEGTATATTGNVRAAGMEVFWDAPLAVGAAAAMTFSVSASYPFTNGALLVSRADVDDGWHPPQRRNITTTIQAPDLTASRLESRPGWVGPKAPFSYTFVLRNTGAAPAVGASLVDPLPDQVMYGWSPLPGGMSFDPALWGLRWTGTLTPGQALTMSVGLSLHPGYVGTITNTAMLYDGLHPPLALEAQTIVPRQRWYLPVVIVDKASPR
jgi:uncharacterized repeat protein (TIGR01451 family)